MVLVAALGSQQLKTNSINENQLGKVILKHKKKLHKRNVGVPTIPMGLHSKYKASHTVKWNADSLYRNIIPKL